MNAIHDLIEVVQENGYGIRELADAAATELAARIELWVIQLRTRENSQSDWDEWHMDAEDPDVRLTEPSQKDVDDWNSISSDMQYRVRRFVAADAVKPQ